MKYRIEEFRRYDGHKMFGAQKKARWFHPWKNVYSVSGQFWHDSFAQAKAAADREKEWDEINAKRAEDLKKNKSIYHAA
jgi:hypothetical protein